MANVRIARMRIDPSIDKDDTYPSRISSIEKRILFYLRKRYLLVWREASQNEQHKAHHFEVGRKRNQLAMKDIAELFFLR